MDEKSGAVRAVLLATDAGALELRAFAAELGGLVPLVLLSLALPRPPFHRVVSIQPQEGLLVIFPGWLVHGVLPNDDEDEAEDRGNPDDRGNPVGLMGMVHVLEGTSTALATQAGAAPKPALRLVSTTPLVVAGTGFKAGALNHALTLTPRHVRYHPALEYWSPPERPTGKPILLGKRPAMLAKAFDGAAPLGEFQPYLDQDLQDLEFTCQVNGELRQHGRTLVGAIAQSSNKRGEGRLVQQLAARAGQRRSHHLLHQGMAERHRSPCGRRRVNLAHRSVALHDSAGLHQQARRTTQAKVQIHLICRRSQHGGQRFCRDHFAKDRHAFQRRFGGGRQPVEPAISVTASSESGE